jgi:hypothetical protein
MAPARIVALAAVALTSGCVSFSVFHGPEVHDPGELSIGVGAATFPVASDSTEDATLPLLPEAGLRYGLGHDFDLGVKFAGFPPFGTIYGDVRWQLLEGPVPMTAGLGGSYVGISDVDGDDISFSAIYPSLAVGTNRLWVAGRGIIISSGVGDHIFVSTQLWGLVAGGSIGDRMKLKPEVMAYFGSDDALVGFGLGLEFRLRDGDDGG